MSINLGVGVGCDAIYTHALKNNNNERVDYESVTPQTNRIEEGLRYLITHFQEPIWPRTISTKTTEGRQILVYNKEEALARFKQANYLDCKICAYPFYVEWKGLNRQAPDLIFIDLDLDRFTSKLGLDKALEMALNNITSKLANAIPTIIGSGHGWLIFDACTYKSLGIKTNFLSLRCEVLLTR